MFILGPAPSLLHLFEHNGPAVGAMLAFRGRLVMRLIDNEVGHNLGGFIACTNKYN